MNTKDKAVLQVVNPSANPPDAPEEEVQPEATPEAQETPDENAEVLQENEKQVSDLTDICKANGIAHHFSNYM